jgi:hypothetical protein
VQRVDDDTCRLLNVVGDLVAEMNIAIDPGDVARKAGVRERVNAN